MAVPSRLLFRREELGLEPSRRRSRLEPPGYDRWWADTAHPIARRLALGPATIAILVADVEVERADEEDDLDHTNAVAWLENEGLAGSGEGLEIRLSDAGWTFLREHQSDTTRCGCAVCRRARSNRRWADQRRREEDGR